MNFTQQNSIIINNREEIEINGVKDVISYDSEKIIFDMNDSELTLNGSNFNLKKIDVDSCSAIVSGKFDSLSFNDGNAKVSKSFLTSLFR